MSVVVRSLCCVVAAGLTGATMSGTFAVLRIVDARLDLISCRQEASLARLSAHHCTAR